jgi:outer membrane protein assembly factor BamB
VNKFPRPATILAAIVLYVACPGLDRSRASGQEWTRFRGPNGSGQCEASTIPATWTAKDYKWRVELPGEGYSSPVVWGDHVYITAATSEEATQIVCCLNASSGEMVWKRTFPSKPYRKNNLAGYASSTPTVDKDRLYVTWVTSAAYTLVALDRQTGKDVWRRDLGPFVSQHGFGASPILVDDLVIVPNDQDGKSSVIAVESATGKTRWTVDRRSEKTAFSTPIVYQPENGPPQLILTSLAHGISSLDPRTGKSLWELEVMKSRPVGSPILAAGLLFAQSGEGGGGKQLFAVRPGDPAKKVEAKIAYEVQGSLPNVPTTVARGQLVFVWSDSGVVTCLDAPSGKVLWRERVGGQFFGSPIRVADRLYCISRTGEVVVLAAADKYKLLGRIDLGEASQSTPAVAGGVMYLRTKGHLMALGGKAGDRSP